MHTSKRKTGYSRNAETDHWKVIINKEVKEIIRKNPKLAKETVDMNKTIVVLGIKEDEIMCKVSRDKHDRKDNKYFV